MTTSSGPSPLVRGALLLFSIAVVGGLIGFGWEMGQHEMLEERDELENLEAELPPVTPGPDWRKGPSAEEREIVQRATSGLPPYKDAVPQPLAADYLGQGSTMAAAWFLTDDAPGEVLGYYRDALLKAGLPPVEHWYSPMAGYVAYMEVESQRVHTVSVVVQGEQTAVFVSAGQVAPFLESVGRVPSAVPMPEGLAQEPVVLTFEKEGRVQYSIVAEVEEGQADTLRTFYLETLGKQGWAVEPAEQTGGPTLLQAQRGPARASVMIQQENDSVKLLITLDQPL